MTDNPLLRKLDELKKKRIEEQERAVANDPSRDECYGPTPVKRKKMKAKDRRRNRNKARRLREIECI